MSTEIEQLKLKKNLVLRNNNNNNMTLFKHGDV